jgi:CRP-like cAMP-binding protein
MRVKADVELLQQIPLFANSEAVHLQLLSFSAQQVELEKGSILFRKGEQGAAAYLVLQGAAEVFADEQAEGEVIATAEGGALLGELSMIANAAYGVTVKTASVLRAKKIDRGLFIRLAAEFPEFGMGVMRNIALRLGRSVDRLDALRPIFHGSS